MNYHKSIYNQMSQEELKDAFINDTLPDDARVAFQDLMNANPELKEEVQMEEALRDMAQEARKKELKAHLSTIDVESPNTIFNVPRTALIGSLMIAGVMTSMLVYFDEYKEYFIFSSAQKIQQTTNNVQNTSSKNTVKENIVIAPTENTTIENTTKNTIGNTVKNVVANVNETNIFNTVKEETKNIAINNNNFRAKNTPIITEPLDISVSSVNRSINQKAITLSNMKVRTKDNNNTSNEQQANVNVSTNPNNNTYQMSKKDNDLGIFDGKLDKTLENDTQGHKLLYQYYSGKLFVYSKNVRGTELHLDEKGNKRHFLYYDKQFYEFFDNQMEKSELKPVSQPELIDKLKKELLNRNR